MKFSFFDPIQPVVITRGHLPHWDQESATYFITWRTSDSLPKAVWEQWRSERAGWLIAHDIDPQLKDWRRQVEELPDSERKDFRRFSKALEDEADAGHGECLLRRAELANITANSLRFFNGSRYTLGDFVVMPNHVHLLVGGMARGAMLKQVESWKKWSALKINETLGRRGRFWQHENFDHLVRNEESFGKFRDYIAQNPSKARLREGEYVYWRCDG